MSNQIPLEDRKVVACELLQALEDRGERPPPYNLIVLALRTRDLIIARLLEDKLKELEADVKSGALSFTFADKDLATFVNALVYQLNVTDVEKCLALIRVIVERSPVADRCDVGDTVRAVVEGALRDGASEVGAVRAGVLASASDKTARQVLKNLTFDMQLAASGADPKR